MKFFFYLTALRLALAAPILDVEDANQVIRNQWIIVLNQGTSNSMLHRSVRHVTNLLGVEPQFIYNFGTFKGYAISAQRNLLDTITNLSEIAYVTPDTLMHSTAITSQNNPPYGLARISHRSIDYSKYIYDDSAGRGSYIYGIDTGIFIQHQDFDGRATFGANFADNNNTDGNGHGTHTAGTAGSTTYGVAKNANLIAVKVLGADGSGSLSQVISGIQYATNDMLKNGRKGKAVANLSLGGIFNQATNQAAAAAVQQGLFLAVAAGNDGLPALLSSPASEPSVCTVGASDKNDSKASFSNFGSVVDVYAPGVDVISTWNTGPNATEVLSGTSMATPHICGLGAYLLALEGPRTPAALCHRIKALATQGKVSGLLPLVGGANLLAYNGNGA